MKSLKKTLSLVLVIVMVLGMFGVAGAAYKDDATITHKEAVDVMSGLKVIVGQGDNTFNPKGNVTRAEAAKMIAYAVLGADVAAMLSTSKSSFSDVGADLAWAIPSIEYLVSKGVIAGVGGGKFAPNDNVTAVQMAKMLLSFIGYGKAGEFSAESWEVNTAILAGKNGIYTGSKTTSYGTAATREEAALYCFNALTSSTAVTVVWSKDKEAYEKSTTNLGTEVYGLAKVSGSADAFGRPSTNWNITASTKPIASTATGKPVLTYTTGVTQAALNLAIVNAGLTPMTATPTTANGVVLTSGLLDTTGNGTAVVGGNGTVIEVYGNTTTGAIDKIVIINTFYGSVAVNSLVADKAATTTIDERAFTATVNAKAVVVTAASKTPGFDAVYALATAAKAAGIAAVPVLATLVPAADGTVAASTTVVTVAAPKYETVTPTSYITNTSYTANGNTYTYSLNFAGTRVAAFAPVDVVYDAYGYVIAAAGASTAAPDVAVVLKAGAVKDDWGNEVFKAELLLSDGTVKAVAAVADYKAIINTTVTYSAAPATGLYTLTALTDTAVAVSAKALSIKTGVPAFSWDSVTYYANAKTLFLVTGGTAAAPTYKAYVGIANVPSLTGLVSGQINHTGNIASVVYLQNPTDAGTPSTDKIFVSSAGYATINTQVGGVLFTYYVAPAVVNGEITTINLTHAPVTGLYTSKITNAAGYNTLGGKTNMDFTASDLIYANGVLKIGATYFGLSADCAIYTYGTTTGAITATVPAGIVSNTSAAGTYTLNAAGQISSIYIAVA